ncbi:MAG TPA: hypothetical protein VFH50_04510 [Acidimicrobiales bacterium]|nr:hypothetical protein [Acidimicrobiales bacterium]
MLDISTLIPGRDSIRCQTTADPYRTAWEAAAQLPIPDAINEVVRRCGIPFDQANLLVFCEVREAFPVRPRP